MGDKSLGLRALIIFIIALALAQSLTVYAVPWNYRRNFVLSDDAQPDSPSKPLLQPVPPPIINPITPTIPTGPSTPVGPQTPTGPSSPTSPKPTSPPEQKPAQPGDQPSQLPKPTQPGQQPSQLPTPTNPSTLPPSPVNPVPNEVYANGMKYIIEITYDDADFLRKVLRREGKKIEPLKLGQEGMRIDNPDEAVEEARQKLKKSGLYDKVDKILRELYHTTLDDVLQEAKGKRIHDGRLGPYRVELKALYDLAHNFPSAVKQMIQDGILQKQGKAKVIWYVNSGLRNFLSSRASVTAAKFDTAYGLIKELGKLFNVAVEGTNEADVAEVLKASLVTVIFQGMIPKLQCSIINLGGLTLTITPVEFKTVGKPVACLNFGEKVYCFDQNGNEVNPANVGVR